MGIMAWTETIPTSNIRINILSCVYRSDSVFWTSGPSFYLAMSPTSEFSSDASSTSSGPIFHLPDPVFFDYEQDAGNSVTATFSHHLDAELDPASPRETNFLLRMRNIDVCSDEDRGYLRGPAAHGGPAAMPLFSSPDPDGVMYFVFFAATDLPFFPASDPTDPARDPQPWISGRFEVDSDYHVHPSRDGGPGAPLEPRTAPGGSPVTEAPRLPRQGLVLGQLYIQSPDPVGGGIEMQRSLFDVVVNADPGVADPEVYIMYNCEAMREWFNVNVAGRPQSGPSRIVFTADVFGGLMERRVPGAKGC
ncbi:hypothetical protein GGTG_07179 [Gaeumannomyces tritici R3-111a-1]|uniref:Uncharacterized protein n=1 Tax=Gaeumannomyces tritici (strain R3-111a-1) TaxID=644352 RepID=J3P0Y3_GAET3|nr:hypothetical protein GGTG_07179 [Gaeumannomyces tritici R3-111a-1]EJT77267.1 hypothetical protein GGTG_07179 [Gaeumannomyces tritici R3-111a-1]